MVTNAEDRNILTYSFINSKYLLYALITMIKPLFTE